jgi:ribose 5-phosphate isomerase A
MGIVANLSAVTTSMIYPIPNAMTHQNDLKKQVAQAALHYVKPGTVVGIGTGSTVNFFIDALSSIKHHITGAISSSEQSTERLRAHGITVFDTSAVARIAVYIDGADEIDPRGYMLKGGGAALTREKIVADIAERFVCIADLSKQVKVLGKFPLPVEVIPMAAPQIVARFATMQATAQVRAGVLTDNGCQIVDVHGLHIHDPVAMECELNQWPGVVTVGIFARNRAHVCLLGGRDGVQTLIFS